MIKVHHLNNSRSQRILWLLEELGQDYEIVKYQRDAVTSLAPPELEKIHPLGKSPVLEDDGLIIHETGAIVEFLVNKYDDGSLAPTDRSSILYTRYSEWLHYAEGSAMLPLLLRLYVSRLGDAGAPLHPRISSEFKNHFSYVSKSLKDDYLLGNELSAADVMMSFPLEAANRAGGLKDFSNLQEYVARFQARDAYKIALEKGGKYDFA
ncbi:glutathione S-transferase family protein [Sneathiella glossodoripedis]|uniref:glutathione S-transferase family protein n=1 Tax=Sneathiella glossodoripedis TaxID=418853 RepID=UPI000470F2B8|nr:glutathione S-transferase [Sneathiella glossodoripedis]